MYHLRTWYIYIGRVASNSLWRGVAVLFQHTFWASLCVCKSWGRRAEWAINCVWLAFHTESNSWGVTRYSVEGINFCQISLFPFFLHPVFPFTFSPSALFCLPFFTVFVFSISFLFPLSFISFYPVFYFLSSLIFFLSFLFLFVSLSLFLYHLLPFVSLLFLLFCFSPVFLCAFAKLRKAVINFVVSVRPPAWNSSTPTGRIFIKFVIWVFSESMSRKVKFDWNLTRTTGVVHETLCVCVCVCRRTGGIQQKIKQYARDCLYSV